MSRSDRAGDEVREMHITMPDPSAFPHGQCEARIGDGFKASAAGMKGRPLHGEVVLSTAPAVDRALGETKVRCPHGTVFWVMPDARMRADLQIHPASEVGFLDESGSSSW